MTLFDRTRFDFSLGYPAGTADALGLKRDGMAPWQAMHAHLASKMKDKADNSNPRYAIAAGMNYAISKGPFPFWGAPARDVVSTLSDKKPDFEGRDLAEYRLAEMHLRESGRAQPKSVWQLAYTGSVGSQSLSGRPLSDGRCASKNESAGQHSDRPVARRERAGARVAHLTWTSPW